jgi:hypothetical protein
MWSLGFPPGSFSLGGVALSFHAYVHRKDKALCLKELQPHANIQDVQIIIPYGVS